MAIPNGDYSRGAKMENKVKRSFLLSTILGDGCLYLSGPKQKNVVAYVSIKHGHKQKDYVEFKAKMLSIVMNKTISVRPAVSYVKALDKSYDQFVMSVGWKRMRAWRKFCYVNNIKRFSRILPFINTPVMAAALWFMDDGSLITARSNRDTDNSKRVCSGLKLYLGECFREDAHEAAFWFERIFKVKPRIHWQDVKYKGTVRTYPELRFTVQDGLVIWANIRNIVMQIPSMLNKFQRLEDRRNRADLIQPQAVILSDKLTEDIVHEIELQNLNKV